MVSSRGLGDVYKRQVYSGNAWYTGRHSNWERQTAKPGKWVRTTAKPVATSNGGTKVTGRITQLVASPTRPLRYVNVHIQARQAYGTYWFDAGSTKTNGHGYFGWNTSVKPSACYRYRAIYKGNSNGWAAKSTTAEWLSLIHISEPTRRHHVSRMPSSA